MCIGLSVNKYYILIAVKCGAYTISFVLNFFKW